jgi:hypothetical protein
MAFSTLSQLSFPARTIVINYFVAYKHSTTKKPMTRQVSDDAALRKETGQRCCSKEVPWGQSNMVRDSYVQATLARLCPHAN